MRRFNVSLLCAACGVMMVSLSGDVVAQSQNENGTAADASPKQMASVELPGSPLPDSPGAVLAQAQNEDGQNQGSAQQSDSNQQPQSSSVPGQSASAPQVQNANPQRPVGTAAAEAPPVSGITAAQPAGIAVAPAKQRRTRTLVLKVGAIIAGGAAVGAIVALSEGTSSRPPGAH
jgi:cytoskeletal protein RodZ